MCDLKSPLTQCTVCYAMFTYVWEWENDLSRTHMYGEGPLQKPQEGERGWSWVEGTRGLAEAANKQQEQGCDIKEGQVGIQGWLKNSQCFQPNGLQSHPPLAE